MTDAVVLGIDAGGSKTLALAAGLDGTILGRARSGPGNYNTVGFAAASSAITDASREALLAAGVQPQQVRALCLGAAGVNRPEDGALWLEWARQAFPDAKASVVNDALVVLASAAPLDCCGLAIIAGTGSIVYGRDDQGNLASAGGWGYMMGDEGSNYALGQAALRAVSRAADNREPATLMTDLILKHWGLAHVNDLVGKVYGETSRKDIARLGRIVEASAEAGDLVARGILEDAGRELALAARAVADKLQLSGTLACALAGAVLTRGERVREAFLRHAEAGGLRLEPVVIVHEPAFGAVRLALEALK